jgi:hypothetical protein
MSQEVTPKQALIMWCVLGQYGWAFQKDIKLKIEPKDREPLVAAGYLSKEKVNQSILLKVEDKGWHWAERHLRDELPANFQVLHSWLSRLDEFFKRSGNTLAEFIGPAPGPIPSPAPKKAPSRARKDPAPKIPKPPSPTMVRQRIEKAYLVVTHGRKAEQALLSAVRAQLADLSREIVDSALLRILQGDEEGERKARLGQINDPKSLTQSDRDAAFSPGGEPFHLLWIQS